MTDLAGKVALITGSSRGIGASIAQLFAEHGSRVAVHGRDEEAEVGRHHHHRFNGGPNAAWITGVTLDVAGGAVML